MIMTPQESLVMKGRHYDQVIKGLQQALASNALVALEGTDKVYAVTTVDDAIPAFSLPMTVYDVMGRKKVCIDLRNGKREYVLNEYNGHYKPHLLTEANFQTNLALAQLAWSEGPADFNNIYYDACCVYAMWISMKIAKRLVLNPQQQNEVMVFCAYYWLTRMETGEYVNDQLYEFIASKISVLFGMNINEVLTILSRTDKLIYLDIDAFSNALSANIDNPKMRGFNRVLLQTIVLGSWLGGLNAREVTAVAVEYPPMFMTILYRALNERSFKNSDITQVALKLLNKTKQDQYGLVFADICKRTMLS